MPLSPKPAFRIAFRSSLPALAALALSLHARSASAEPPVPAAAPSISVDAELPDVEVTRRVDFIEDRLRRGTPALQRWWYGWIGGWTALSLGQMVVAVATTNTGLRKDAAVAGAASSLPVFALGVFPFPALTAAQRLGSMPATTPAERRRKLARAEELLKASAAGEQATRAWPNHLLIGGVSVGVGLVLAFVYKRPVTGALSGVAGIGLSEAQIFTQPTAAIHDWDEYRRSIGESVKPAPQAVQWMITPYGGGAAIVGRF